MPERIQLRRTKGWRKPEGAVVVARPSRWGNPYRADVWDGAAKAVELFRHHVAVRPELARQIREHLAGRDLACWCPLVNEHGEPMPCHADVLLEIANGDRP